MAGNICTDGWRRGHARADARNASASRHGRRVGGKPNPADGFAVGECAKVH
jgi:hypothetical protein